MSSASEEGYGQLSLGALAANALNSDPAAVGIYAVPGGGGATVTPPSASEEGNENNVSGSQNGPRAVKVSLTGVDGSVLTTLNIRLTNFQAPIIRTLFQIPDSDAIYVIHEGDVLLPEDWAELVGGESLELHSVPGIDTGVRVQETGFRAPLQNLSNFAPTSGIPAPPGSLSTLQRVGTAVPANGGGGGTRRQSGGGRSAPKRRSLDHASGSADTGDGPEDDVGSYITVTKGLLDGDFLRKFVVTSDRRHVPIPSDGDINVRIINAKLSEVFKDDHIKTYKVCDTAGLEIPDDRFTSDPLWWSDGQKRNARKYTAISAQSLVERESATKLYEECLREGNDLPKGRMKTSDLVRARALSKLDKTVVQAAKDLFRCNLCMQSTLNSPIICKACHQLVGCATCLHRSWDQFGTNAPARNLPGKKCPLCGENWIEEEGEEVGFVLRGVDAMRRALALQANPPFPNTSARSD